MLRSSVPPSLSPLARLLLPYTLRSLPHSVGLILAPSLLPSLLSATHKPTHSTLPLPLQLLMIDRPMFLQLASAPEGSAGAAIAAKIRERAEARQRARLSKAIEMMAGPLQRVQVKPGEAVFEQVG